MKKELIFGLIMVLIVSGGLFFVFNKKEEKKQRIEIKKVEQETPKKSSFSISDVAKHNNENDCWIVIDGKVYDVTSYIESHPGGRVMANFCGQDGSLAFATKGKNKPHSPAAYEILKTLYIGDLSQ
jgi:cytochrome b involved in lipid metabolism